MAASDALQQVSYTTSSVALLRRDSVLAQMDRRVSRHYAHQLRSSPFQAKEMFEEEAIKQARVELDWRKDKENTALNKRKEVDLESLTSIQYSRPHTKPADRSTSQDLKTPKTD